MTDATTSNYGWTKPTVGADANAWGGILNADLDSIDADLFAVSQSVVIARPSGEVTAWGGPTTKIPSGWLLCDGSAVSRTTYASLFAAIGVYHGPGDGSTTFNLPNLKDQFIVGAGNLYALAATGGLTSQTTTIGGHALTISELPVITPTVIDSGHVHTATDAGHVHTAMDSGHAHGVVDGGHVHPLNNIIDNNGPSLAGHSFGTGTGNLEVVTTSTGSGSANVTSTANADANITVASAHANITVSSAETGITIGSFGGGAAHTHSATNTTNLPPYYALFFIIKT